MDHSLLSPSSAHRWIECPASVARCKDIPNKSTKYADEGTLAHAIAADCLKDDVDVVGSDYSHYGVRIADDMVEPVNTYLQTVRAMSQGAVATWVEQELDLSGVLDIDGEKGTADFIALMPDGELQVHDLKYGKGVRVEAEGNAQGQLYALGALEVVELVSDKIERVRIVIHQPRLNSVSETVVTVEELRGFAKRAALRAAEAVHLYEEGCENADYNPGEKQCRFCPAKGECEALAEYNLSTILDDFDGIESAEQLGTEIKQAITDICNTDNTRIAALLGNVDLIKSWANAVLDCAMGKALNGEELPGYKLVEGRAGDRAWRDETVAEERMKSMRLKKDEMYSFKVISPTKAEKLLAKESPRKWKKLTELITRSDPKPTIVPVTDKRPAWTPPVVTTDEFQDETQTPADDAADLL